MAEQRIQPHDLSAEQSLLGALLMSTDSFFMIKTPLKEVYFYKRAHQVIFSAIMNLYKINSPIDAITVADHLSKQSNLEVAGGRAYLVELLDSIHSTQNVDTYATIIFEKALLRQIIDTGTFMLNQAFDPSNIAKDVLVKSQSLLTTISNEGITKDFVHLKDILGTVFDDLQSSSSQENGILGIASGFPNLDTLTSGFQSGDLVILAARPSMGKTTLALNFAVNAAIQNQVPIAVFSCEMPKEQLGLRMLCSRAKLNSSLLRSSNMSETHFRQLNAALRDLSEAPIFIDDTPSITPLDLRIKAQRLQKKHDVKLILIDYLQLMRLGNRRIESRFQEVSEIVRDIKAFAKESNIPIIALSQLSRDIEKHQRRPVLSDLRESGEIEQTADLIMFIYSEPKPNTEPNDDILESVRNTQNLSPEVPVKLIIAKQRNGPTGDINLIFKKYIYQFLPDEMS